MSSSSALRKIALPLLVAFGVLYLFGMRSGVTTIALLVISLAVLYFVMSELMEGVHATQKTLDASERTYSYAGRDFRVFVDEQNGIWLRASDLKCYLAYDQTDAWLARSYPARYHKVHPQIDAWYMHHEALREFMGKSRSDSVQHFLTWLSREVVGMHRFEMAMTPARPGTPKRQVQTAKPRNFLFTWFIRHWRGETGLMWSVFGGGLAVASASQAAHLLNLLDITDITLHYRWSALIYVMQITVVSGSMYWWARGVLHSTQRWIAAERSLLVAMLASVLGIGGVFYALSHMVDTDKQYFLTDFFTIMLDADHKPEVRYQASARRIVLDGELGFGATNLVRQMLLDHPEALSIELKSYGGRVSEGFGLMRLIDERHLETYVQAECMSACVIAYIGGWQRHVASSAVFGLHRSGHTWQAGKDGLNEADQAIANAMHSIGVDEAFITRGLKPSIHEIYLPTAQEVLEARLATVEWI